MKLFLLLSEGVQIAMVTGIGAIIVALIPFSLALYKLIKGQMNMHREMNGMKKELVETTAALAKAIGNREGREELKQELKSETTADIGMKTSIEPMPVVVTNAEPLSVVVTKNTGK